MKFSIYSEIQHWPGKTYSRLYDEVLEQLAEMPYQEMIDTNVIWVGTPHDVIERIEAVQQLCDGLTEVSITVNAGGFAHWQSIKAQEVFCGQSNSAFQSDGGRCTNMTLEPAATG